MPPRSPSTDPGEFPGDLGRSWACDSNKYDVFSCPPCGQGQPIRKQRHFLGQMFYPSVSVWTRLHLFFILEIYMFIHAQQRSNSFFFVEIICTREQIIQWYMDWCLQEHGSTRKAQLSTTWECTALQDFCWSSAIACATKIHSIDGWGIGSLQQIQHYSMISRFWSSLEGMERKTERQKSPSKYCTIQLPFHTAS